MKPTDLVEEYAKWKKLSPRARIWLLVGLGCLAVASVATALAVSWANETGKRLASPGRGDSVAPAVPVAIAPIAPAPGPKLPDPSSQDPARVYPLAIAGAPARGPAEAPLTIVEFVDFEGPFSRRASVALSALEGELPGKIRRVYKASPRSEHLHARLAARAVLAADAHGKFWEMHDALMVADSLDEASIEAIAERIGISRQDFLSDLARVDDRRIDTDLAQGNAFHFKLVPVVFMNGHKLEGARPLEAYRAEALRLLANP